MEGRKRRSLFLCRINFITYFLICYSLFVIKHSNTIFLEKGNRFNDVYYYPKNRWKRSFSNNERNKIPYLFLKKRNNYNNALANIKTITIKDIDSKKKKNEDILPSWQEVKVLDRINESESESKSKPEFKLKRETKSELELKNEKEKKDNNFLNTLNKNEKKEEGIIYEKKRNVSPVLDKEGLDVLNRKAENEILKNIFSKFWGKNRKKVKGKSKEEGDQASNNEPNDNKNGNGNNDEHKSEWEEEEEEKEEETENVDDNNNNNNNEKQKEKKEELETNFLLKSLESGHFPNFCLVENVDEHADNFDIYLGKEKMKELNISDGFTVLLKGKKKREMLGIARLNKKMNKCFVVISPSMKKNLKVGHNDIIKIYPFLKSKKIKKVIVSPFSDTAENLSKEEMRKTIIQPYFLKHNYSPLSIDNSLYINYKNKRIEVKVIKIETEDNEEASNGFISADTEIVLAEEYLNREDFEDNTDDITYEDLGGIKKQLNKIRELIELPLKYPEIFVSIGISAPKGVLMHGIPGTGKTSIAKAIANESNAYCFIINGPEIMSKHIGESEQKLRKIFKKASEKTPCIIFIDEIDSIANKRSKSNNELEKRVVSQLLTLMDGLKKNSNVLVLGATNRPNAIDPALRRFGRFDREIEIPVPDEQGRYEILLTKTKKMKLNKDVNLRKIAKECHGYVGADLAQLCFEAAIQCIKEHIHCLDLEEEDFIEFMKISMISKDEEIKNDVQEKHKKLEGNNYSNNNYNNEMTKDMNANDTMGKYNKMNKFNTEGKFFNLRKREESKKELANDVFKKTKEGKDKLDRNERKIPAYILNKLTIKAKHFQHALNICNPSSLRERQAQIPTVTWKDIGGMNEVKEQLKETILYPLEYKNLYNKFNSNYNKGILLYGPPGCGKTLLAKAIANECNANFISVKGPELLTMWFGESEANVRDLFDKARAASPCIIFFDEIDSLAKERNSNNNNDASDRVINQILTEIDGINEKKTIFIIAATNRPDILDKALTRPGRLDKLIYISLPDYKSRYSIFKAILKNTPLSKDVNIHEMAKKTEGFSGADITNLCQSAVNEAIKETIHLLKKRKGKNSKGKNSKGNKNKENNETELEDPVPCLEKKHFDLAFKNARISIQPEDVIKYENFKKKLTLHGI